MFVFAATKWKAESADAGHSSNDAHASKGILTVLASPHEGHSHDDCSIVSEDRAGGCKHTGCSSLSH